MQEAMKLFNFQLPYRTFEELRNVSQRNNCAIAEIIRSGVNKALAELKEKTEGSRAK